MATPEIVHLPLAFNRLGRKVPNRAARRIKHLQPIAKPQLSSGRAAAQRRLKRKDSTYSPVFDPPATDARRQRQGSRSDSLALDAAEHGGCQWRLDNGRRSGLWLNNGSCVRFRAERRDHVCAHDIVEERPFDRRRPRALCVTDELAREAPARPRAHGLRSSDAINALANLMIWRGPCRGHRQRPTYGRRGLSPTESLGPPPLRRREITRVERQPPVRWSPHHRDGTLGGPQWASGGRRAVGACRDWRLHKGTCLAPRAWRNPPWCVEGRGDECRWRCLRSRPARAIRRRPWPMRCE